MNQIDVGILLSVFKDLDVSKISHNKDRNVSLLVLH